MKRAYSVSNVMNAKFKTLPFDGQWLEAVGCPQLGGSWLIYGAPKNGKTSLAMQALTPTSAALRAATAALAGSVILATWGIFSAPSLVAEPPAAPVVMPPVRAKTSVFDWM